MISDDRLYTIHHWAAITRALGIAAAAVFSVVAFYNNWPKWAIAILPLPLWVAGLVAVFVVDWCRWLEDRRGWEPPDLTWSSFWW
jgi:hypothetical protein